MLTWRQWLRYVLAPMLAVIGLDQVTKWAARVWLQMPHDYDWVYLGYYRNTGFMLGSNSDANAITTIVVPTVIAGFLTFACFVVQYMLPLKSPTMRVGISIFLGGVLSNVVDRMITAGVTDFLAFRAWGLASGVFNMADSLQFVGIGMALGSYIANGSLLYPAEQRRGRKWIDPAFQGRYCLIMSAVGAAFAMIAGGLSYTFIKHWVADAGMLDKAMTHGFVRTFLLVYGFSTLTFLGMLFVLGIHMSHRIVGPIKAFENYVEGLARGEDRQFRLRQGDDLRQLEAMADRFQLLFNERNGVTATPLAAGVRAPAFRGRSWRDEPIELDHFRGKRVWLMFYRYASCPLCAVYLDDARDAIVEAKKAGVEVIAVYESKPEDFIADRSATLEMLRGLDIIMVADHERRLYRAFRTRRGAISLLRLSVWRTFFEARRRGFKQGQVKGDALQTPAHFFIDEKGIVVRAHYGGSFVDHVDLAEVKAFCEQSHPKSIEGDAS